MVRVGHRERIEEVCYWMQFLDEEELMLVFLEVVLWDSPCVQRAVKRWVKIHV